MNHLRLLFYISCSLYFNCFIQSTVTYTIQQSSMNRIDVKVKEIDEQNNLWKNQVQHDNESQSLMISPVRFGVWKKSKRNGKHKRNKHRRKLYRHKKILRYL
ncbi:unnamed protein product [Schistosoma guineensis]|nr:unnamed protein product [Schistosoma guineensis]